MQILAPTLRVEIIDSSERIRDRLGRPNQLITADQIPRPLHTPTATQEHVDKLILGNARLAIIASSLAVAIGLPGRWHDEDKVGLEELDVPNLAVNSACWHVPAVQDGEIDTRSELLVEGDPCTHHNDSPASPSRVRFSYQLV